MSVCVCVCVEDGRWRGEVDIGTVLNLLRLEEPDLTKARYLIPREMALEVISRDGSVNDSHESPDSWRGG